MFPVAVQAPADYQNDHGGNADIELIVEVLELILESVQKVRGYFFARY